MSEMILCNPNRNMLLWNSIYCEWQYSFI